MIEVEFGLAEPDSADYSHSSDAYLARRLADFSESALEEYWATLALRHCEGLGARSQARLLKKFNGAYAACKAVDLWGSVGIKQDSVDFFRKGLWRSIAKKEWDKARKSDSCILLWASREYPDCLRELVDPPPLLYCHGDIGLLAGPCLGIVGSRNPTSESARIAARLAGPASACGITVVSGMALGIDRAAHSAAITGVGRSIGVLGAGIDVEYPKSNTDIFAKMRADGLLVSEFAPDAAPVSRNFPIRNRIISGLSLGVVVVEAAVRSGSLITAKLALEQNREVFAVPGSALNNHSLGCQNLVRQGARPVFSMDDILRDLASLLAPFGVTPAPGREPPDLNIRKPAHIDNLDRPDLGEKDDSPSCSPKDIQPLLTGSASEKTLAALKSGGPMHTDMILEKTGLKAGELSAALLALEMLGQIRLLPGSRYEAAYDR